MLGVKNLSVGICNGAPSTARSSYVLNEQKTCASLAFDGIKNKKSGLICFGGNKNLPASSVFQKKSGLKTLIYFFYSLTHNFFFGMQFLFRRVPGCNAIAELS